MNHPAKLAELIARRNLPGHCPSCGKYTGGEVGPRGGRKCGACKLRNTAWKTKRRPSTQVDGAAMALVTMVELRAVRAELATLRKRVAAAALKEYEHGRDRGRREERKRMARLAKQAQRRPVVAPWDAWDEQVGIDEQKQQCHRLAMACEG